MIRNLLLALSLALPLAAPAQATTQGEVLDAQFLPGWRTEKGTHMAALQLTMAPEWKTYWRSPGDSGIPPLFDWSGSENLRAVAFHWPTPVVFHINGMQTIGYHDVLILPIEVTARDPQKPIHLKARIDLGICRDICMPAQVDLEALLTPPGAPDAAIRAALADRPVSAREAGLRKIRCVIEPLSDGIRVSAEIDLPSQGPAETVVFETGQPDIWVAESTAARAGRVLSAVTEMVAPSGEAFAIDRSRMTVTVLGGGKSVEIRGCPAG